MKAWYGSDPGETLAKRAKGNSNCARCSAGGERSGRFDGRDVQTVQTRNGRGRYESGLAFYCGIGANRCRIVVFRQCQGIAASVTSSAFRT